MNTNKPLPARIYLHNPWNVEQSPCGCDADIAYVPESTLATVRQETFRSAIQIVDTAPGCHSAGKWYIDPVALVQRLNAALELTTNLDTSDDKPNET